jgi:HEAT repeat protein
MRISRRSRGWLALGGVLCGLVASGLAYRAWRGSRTPNPSFVTEADYRRALSEVRSPELGRRRTAIITLAFSGNAESRSTLGLALRESNVEMRRIAALGLGLLADPNSVDALRRAIQDPDPAVAVDGAWGLGRLPEGRGHETLERAFTQGRPAERVLGEALVFGLARVGSPKAPSAILRGQLEQDAAWAKDPAFSLVMGWALHRMQSPRAFELLPTAGRDQAARAAQLALDLPDCRGLESVVDWLAAGSRQDSHQGISNEMEHMQQLCAVSVLVRRLSPSFRSEQRRAAAELMVSFGDQQSVRALLAQVGDTDSNVSEAVRETLSRMGTPLPPPSGEIPSVERLAFLDPFGTSAGEAFGKALAASTTENIGQVADAILHAHGTSSVAKKESYRLWRELLESLFPLGMPKTKDLFGWLDESNSQGLARGLLSKDASVVNQVQALWLLFDRRADPLIVALTSSDDERLRKAAEELKAKANFPPSSAAATSPFLAEAETQPDEASLLRLAKELVGSTNRLRDPGVNGPPEDGGREYFSRRSMEFDDLRGHVSPRVEELLLAGMELVTEDYANGIVELLATAPLARVASRWVRVFRGPDGVRRQAFLRNTCIRELSRLRYLDTGAERDALVAWLAETLGSQDPLLRKASVCLAHAMPDRRLTEPLSKLLASKLESDERYLAVASLAKNRDERAVSVLEAALDEPGHIPDEAANGLGRLPLARSRLALLRAATRPSLRAIAVSSLVARSDYPVWDALVDRELWAALPGQPWLVLKALTQSKRGVAPEFLLPQLQVAVTAGSAAKLLGRREASRWLIPLLASEAPSQVIVEVLSKLQESSLAQGLVGALQHPASRVRAHAALCLGARRDPPALDGLIGALNDPHRRVRTAALEALGRLGDRRALPAVGELVVHRAIGNPEFSLALSTWAGLVGEPAVTTLSEFVLRRTKNQDHMLRRAAIRALGATRSRRGVELLRQVIEEGRAGIVEAAIRGLGASGRPEAIDILRLLLNGSWARTAANELIELNLPQTIPVLRELADRYRDRGDATEETLTRQALARLGDEPADSLWE